MADNTQVCQLIDAEAISGSRNRVLLDVRSPIEFEAEHIPESVNIPLADLEQRCEEISRQGELIVICRSGKRAERGAYTLLGKGFQPKILEGGLVGWRKAGKPVKEGRKMLSIERQIQLIVGISVLCGVVLGAFVSPWFLIVPAFFGAGLTFAGASGTCALGLLLARAPWNRLPIAIKGESGDTAPPKTGCCS